MRLEMKYKKKPVKNINMWKLNNMVLNDQRATEEITEEIKKKKHLETKKTKA